ncbi:prefoldin subunit 6-like [Schistocerca gregaria]|uniref:prefoldin subunit 6-like n=1 Tax=Schistocerca gregaria TaxID=7010 RepID=UPI00211EB3BF|nr:prefoldin subunit 6-like [Schistocerca gregaria]XP_049849766.1 prefoldin subunit 6-like [Schistocerca gregaria]
MGPEKSVNLLRELEQEMRVFQKIEESIESIQNRKRNRLSQINENEMVKEELKYVAADAVMYKLIGPTLIKKDKAEVAVTVDERLKYLQKEIKEINVEYTTLLENKEKQREIIISLKKQVQASR